jgi:hypothetical protein
MRTEMRTNEGDRRGVSRLRGPDARTLRTLFVLVAALLFGARAQAQAPNPNSKLCFRNAFGVPGFVKPPVIDGCLRGCSYPSDTPNTHDDFGWVDSFEFVANPSASATSTDVVVRGTRNATTNGLVLAFDVKNDNRLDDTDAIVVALEGVVPGAPAGRDYALLVIYPFLNGAGAAVNGAIPHAGIGAIQYTAGTKTGTTITWDATSTPGPTWVTAAVTSGGSGTNWTWTIEAHIQLGDAGIMLTNTGFDFFLDAIRVYNPGSLLAADFPWPPAATAGNQVDALTPTVDKWGVATINSGTCGGVSFTPSNITTNNANPSLISKTTPNRFSVSLANTLVDTRPGPNQNKPIAAEQVTATFRIANFGLPAALSWAPIPGGNDTSNTATVPAATTVPAGSTIPPGAIGVPGAVTLSTPAPGWVPDAGWTSVNSGHQCILAELKSPSSDVIFLNRAAYRNMNYGTNPGIDPFAFIDGRWGPAPAGKSVHTFDLSRLNTMQYAYGDGTVEDVPIGKLTAQLTVLFLGYRHTGRFIELQKQKHQVVEPIGHYGYVVQHELSKEFETTFTEKRREMIDSIFHSKGTDAEKWHRVNERLSEDPEKPALADWQAEFPQLKPINQDGSLLRIEVPPDSVAEVKGAIRYLKDQPGTGPGVPRQPGGCCGAAGRASGGGAAVPLAGAALLLLGGRRRQRHS